MTTPKYIKGKDGKFVGSIGEGKSCVPTAGVTPAQSSIASPSETPQTLAETYDKYCALASSSEPRIVEVNSVAELKRALATPGVTMVSTQNNFRAESTGSLYEITQARSKGVVTSLTTLDGDVLRCWHMDYPTANEFEANSDGTWTAKATNGDRTYAVFASKDEAERYITSHREELEHARAKAAEHVEVARREHAEKERVQMAANQERARQVEAIARAEYAKNPRTCDRQGCGNPAEYGVSSCQSCLDDYKRLSKEREARRHRNEQQDNRSMADLIANEGVDQDRKVTLINKRGTAINKVRLFRNNGAYGYLPPGSRSRGIRLEPSDWVIQDSKGNILHAGSETTEVHVKLLCDVHGYSDEEARLMIHLMRSGRLL